MIPDYPNTTETMAEREWRYGENYISDEKTEYLSYFVDGSIMTPNGVVTLHDWHLYIPDDCLYDGREP